MTTGAPDLVGLSQRIGYEFNDSSLLLRALRHRSWCAEHAGHESNERLEFLGDAILGWVVADLAFTGNQHLPEGKLTDLRKAVVNANALGRLAVDLGLGPELLLGKGEAAAGGRLKTSILSDAFEAVIGAVYVDGGVTAAFDFVVRFLAPKIAEVTPFLDELDQKTVLQELTARQGLGPPTYVVRGEGPDHLRHFFAEVVVGLAVVGRGEGSNKKQAEQMAAKDAGRSIANAVAPGAPNS